MIQFIFSRNASNWFDSVIDFINAWSTLNSITNLRINFHSVHMMTTVEQWWQMPVSDELNQRFWGKVRKYRQNGDILDNTYDEFALKHLRFDGFCKNKNKSL